MSNLLNNNQFYQKLVTMQLIKTSLKVEGLELTERQKVLPRGT